MKDILKNAGLTKVLLSYVSTDGKMQVITRVVPVDEIERIVALVKEVSE